MNAQKPASATARMRTSSSIRPASPAPAMTDLEEPRRRVAENAAPLAVAEIGRLDHLERLEIADREGIIGTEHHLLGAGDIAEETQRLRLEQDSVEIEP